MSRKIVRLTLDHLESFHGPCRSCLFWELDPVRRERVADAPADRAAEKDAWVSEVLREWGSCGRVALVDDRPVGYLVYAPEAFVRERPASRPRRSPRMPCCWTMAWVEPAYRSGGLGRMLVQGVARDVIRRGGIGAIEAYGDARGRPGRCLLPADFLGSVGFKTHRAHPTSPRMRMDLRTAVTWRDEVDAAIDRVLGALRPAPKSTRASRAQN